MTKKGVNSVWDSMVGFTQANITKMAVPMADSTAIRTNGTPMFGQKDNPVNTSRASLGEK